MSEVETLDALKTRWTGERIARLGFLLGMGWDAKRIANDPLIRTTSNNVHRQAQRFGLAFRAANSDKFKLSSKQLEVFDKAAEKRGLTRECLITLLVKTVAGEQDLLENILDDQLD
ncbi:unnamed protein product [Sphagnum tenellum]